MSFLFNEILVRPLFNALTALIGIMPGGSTALAIIVLTVVIRFILYPLSHKSITSQKAMQELQPELREIQQKHKGDKEKQSRAMMELYQQRGVSPFSGCLPLLVQLPVLFALYRVFLLGFTEESFQMLYTFVPQPEAIMTTLFGIIDLSQRSVTLALVVGVVQFFHSRQMMQTRPATPTASSDGVDMQALMGKQMMYVMPIITVVISWTLPSGLPLYWLTTTVFSIIQHTRV